jgi:hypothetical protein
MSNVRALVNIRFALAAVTSGLAGAAAAVLWGMNLCEREQFLHTSPLIPSILEPAYAWPLERIAAVALAVALVSLLGRWAVPRLGVRPALQSVQSLLGYQVVIAAGVAAGVILGLKVLATTCPNPSIERTATGGLRPPASAAHVER